MIDDTLETELRRRIELDAAWVVRAPALVRASFWHDAGLQIGTCASWRVPAAEELFADTTPWWRQKARLGHHFENVHAALLRAQTGVVVHALNHAVQGVTQTLGELDCLYTDSDGDVVHREVAVKYFLGIAESSAPRNWVGTSKTDRLDLKLQRLTEHQAQLCMLARQRNLWPPTLPFPSRREVLMLGAFFRHPNHAAWPDIMGSEAEGGFWCTTDELVALAGEQSRWACLRKPWWLSGEHRWSALSQRATQIAAAVEAQQNPQLVAALDDVCSLRGRGFVVPRGWNDGVT